jgi:hypothetical protein
MSANMFSSANERAGGGGGIYSLTEEVPTGVEVVEEALPEV